ncbi:MAG: sigma-70 family RNA polymerase sigma factor [Planctomycetota bacterium]
MASGHTENSEPNGMARSAMTSPNRPDDLEQLLAAMQRAATDPDSTALLTWLPRLRTMAHKHLPVKSPLRAGFDSEDLVQEGMLQLVRSVHEFRGSTWPEFLAFVHAMLAQKTQQQARRHAVRQKEFAPEAASEDVPGPQPTPSVDAMAAEDRARVRRLVAELPEPYRTTLQLRLDGVEAGAIAVQLGITDLALRQRLSRGLRMLQERWR